MRIKASSNNILPLYRDEKYLYARQCPSCGPLIFTPTRRLDGGIEAMPKIELIYDVPTVLSGVLVKDNCTDQVIDSFQLVASTRTIKGIDYYFFNSPTVGLGIPEGSYYFQIIQVVDGDPSTIISEPYCVTNKRLCWKLSYWNDCDSPNGLEDFKHELWIDQIDFEKPQVEDVTEEKINGDSTVVITPISSKTIDSFNICGNDHISQSLAKVKGFDNIELENILTGEVFKMNELSILDGGGSCEYPIGLEFVSDVTLYDKCCDSNLELLAPCPTDPNSPNDCDGYSVVINHNNGILTYTETGAPAASTSQWLVNGAPNGNGSAITLGAFGTYIIQTTAGKCIVSDTFTYNDPCAASSLTVSANGPVISGSAYGDTNITFTICNSANQQIGTGLPFTVPLSEGDGFFTVKSQGDNCSKQQTVYVTVTPPLACDHTATIAINNGILTGSSTGCPNALDNEFIELEDENGNISIVSTTNTFTPTVTGLYWYNAICNGCLKRAYKLVNISDCDEGPTGTCDDPFYYIECEKPNSGEETKVTKPK